MTQPRIALDEWQLRAAHRSLDIAVSFEVAQEHPALLVCMTNLAESRARRSAERAARLDIKRLAANDID